MLKKIYNLQMKKFSDLVRSTTPRTLIWYKNVNVAIFNSSHFNPKKYFISTLCLLFVKHVQRCAEN